MEQQPERTAKEESRKWCYCSESVEMGTEPQQPELLGEDLVLRFEKEVAAALRRKPAHEALLAGGLRVLAPHSKRLRALTHRVVFTLVKRGSYDRSLYGACGRCLAETDASQATPHLSGPLASESAGGLSTLSAATLITEPALREPLARAAVNRHPHLAFAAELARALRRESDGSHGTSLAPKIKESHRIALCAEVLVPLSWGRPLPLALAPALGVLRSAERHLGRWLLLGELAVRAGDKSPVSEAEERARRGAVSAQAAWSLVAWALKRVRPSQGAAQTSETPSKARATLELVARLSDRPSAERDVTFLYRLSAAELDSARPILESFTRGKTLSSEAAIRSAFCLARHHGREDLKARLVEAARNPRQDSVRGLAAAALFDLGDRALAAELSEELARCRQLPSAVWAGLIRARAAKGSACTNLISEPNYRRIQLGWVE